MKNILVTICITTYNRDDILPETIKSVQNQTYNNLEIIIIDDCSTDNTEKLIKQYIKKDKRIRYIKHKINLGLASARNTGIKNARGKYISFIDDDDKWEPTFINDFIKLALNYDENWCFCCGTKRYYKQEKIICSNYNGYLLDYIKKGHTPPVSAQFYQTVSLKQVKGYNKNIKSGVDHDIWLKLAFNGIKIKSLKKCLSLPNSNLNFKLTRLTTNFDKRLKNLKESLNIWKKDIENNIGLKFYKKFYNSYIIYVYKYFILYNLQSKNINEAIHFFLRSPMKLKLIYKIIYIFFFKISQIGKKTKNEYPLLLI